MECLGGCPQAESAGLDLPAEHALDAFLILKAFAAGTTALTGVEAIADGVQAFRYPQSKNAATTLAVMGVLATTMFLGISVLASGTNVVYEEHAARTVVAQDRSYDFRRGLPVLSVAGNDGRILILAANTAFQDFPRLSSILGAGQLHAAAVHEPRRPVWSSRTESSSSPLLAALLVLAFDADLNRLIQLYLVGVFISFTLSQSGMVLRWRRLREPGWKRRPQ